MVVVKEGSTVPKGCLIGDRVVIGPDANLQAFERLSMKKVAAQDGDEDEEDNSDVEEVEASELDRFH